MASIPWEVTNDSKMIQVPPALQKPGWAQGDATVLPPCPLPCHPWGTLGPKAKCPSCLPSHNLLKRFPSISRGKKKSVYMASLGYCNRECHPPCGICDPRGTGQRFQHPKALLALGLQSCSAGGEDPGAPGAAVLVGKNFPDFLGKLPCAAPELSVPWPCSLWAHLEPVGPRALPGVLSPGWATQL